MRIKKRKVKKNSPVKLGNLVPTNCPSCENSSSYPYDSEGGYNYVKCSYCGTIYLNPRPSDNQISEASKTGQHRVEEGIVLVNERYKTSKIKSLKRILLDFFTERQLQNKSWLDVGCGMGEFIMALESLGVNARGSEPNEYKMAFCKKRGLDVGFFDLKEHKEKYDFVSLMNVYSHLPNPLEFLEDLKNLLKPGGSIFLQTGHSAHLNPKDHHKPYQAPDHLSFINKEIMEMILKKKGFEGIRVRRYRMPFFPRLYEPKKWAIELGKIALKRGGSFGNFLPKEPNRDMFVLASKKEE